MSNKKIYFSNILDGNIGFNVIDNKTEFIKNRQKIAKKLGFNLNQLIAMQQNHSANIAIVGKQELGFGSQNFQSAIKDTDGLITNHKACVLLALSADCPLIMLRNKNYRAVLHAGYKGIQKGILTNCLSIMQKELNLDIAKTELEIMPCAQSCCYEIGQDLAKSFGEQNFADCIEQKQEKTFLSLKKVLVKQATAFGVIPKNIKSSNICTICNKDFFSYRRQGKLAGRQGLFFL